MSDSISSGQFRFYIFPFLTVGVTVRVEVFRGGVWCYASDTNRNPNSRDYIWRLYISEYNDSYIDPTSLGRTAGSFLFIAIEGTESTNSFTLNTTTGDTSIASKSVLTIHSMYFRYANYHRFWTWCWNNGNYSQFSDQVLFSALLFWRNNSQTGCLCWVHHLLCL